jgi:hypothetical protein
MSFSTKQNQLLRRNLDIRQVKRRTVNGRDIAYLEGWYVMSEANRIFGYDGWNRETLETKCVVTRETRGAFLAVYTARVRITVHTDDLAVIRDGHGTGEGRGESPGEAHDTALKAAETDATKRALATFGRPFGLELYRRDNREVRRPTQQPALPGIDLPGSLHPDDTTPIPRPSTHYGRRQFLESRERAQNSARQRVASPSPGADQPPEPVVVSNEQSVLPIGRPRRLRDKAHLNFVASQPCLVCARLPSDAHHLRFAQPRAIGMKVSDEFTVPLCRTHHRLLHQSGREAQWWEDLDIDAMEIAKGLWEQSRLRTSPSLSADDQASSEQASGPESEDASKQTQE